MKLQVLHLRAAEKDVCSFQFVHISMCESKTTHSRGSLIAWRSRGPICDSTNDEIEIANLKTDVKGENEEWLEGSVSWVVGSGGR